MKKSSQQFRSPSVDQESLGASSQGSAQADQEDNAQELTPMSDFDDKEQNFTMSLQQVLLLKKLEADNKVL
jgi:hypothetical protein|tara:strand:+ start:738 stop:950 length:213 start_codon:yes stop_codon:yes gene_type:complete